MINGRTVELDVRYYPDSAGSTSSSSSSTGSGSSGTAQAGATVTLTNAPFYVSSTSTTVASRKSGTFYYYDGKLINGRYRITNSAERCGKLPVGQNVTGWVPASDCGGTSSGTTTATQTVASSQGGWQIGDLLEDFSYEDSASDNSDSISITIDAADTAWIGSNMPKKGAKVVANVAAYNWESQGDNGTIQCGIFILDDISYSDSPSKLSVNGTSKPANTDFSELEREDTHKNTSLKGIGQKIADRYGLGFTYDGDDYEIDCDDQSASDSSYYNNLCKKYGMILKVYAGRLWVYDREQYKEKPAVRTYTPSMIKRGSLKYSSELYGLYTGGDFSYTDPDKDCDISCSVGSGNHTKSLSQRASSVYDASVQLCAAINNENHGTVTLSFTVPGDFHVCSGNNIQLSGYGSLDGKYFVDKVSHKISKSNGFTTQLDCSGIGDSFKSYMVGGSIVYNEQDDSSSSESYTSTYSTTSPAAASTSASKGATAGGSVSLTNAPFYVSSTAKAPACYKTGTFYYYDGILVNNRYRMTNTSARCGKLPVGQNVTGWVPSAYCSPQVDEDDPYAELETIE